jgi:hypothetical protein
MTGGLHEDHYTLMTISRSVLRTSNFSDKSCTENQNTFYVQKLYFENRAVYEIMWKTKVRLNIPHMTI